MKSVLTLLTLCLALGSIDFVHAAEETDHTSIYEGIERRYLVYAPDSWDGKKKLPLVVAFHPFWKSPEFYMLIINGKALAEKHNYILAFPKAALVNWNNGYLPEEKPYDDQGFVLKMLDEMKERYNYDEKRVYLLGYSSGGYMAYKMAAEVKNTFAAVGVTGAATATELDIENTPAIPIIHYHGVLDRVVALEGGYSIIKTRSARLALYDWIAINKVEEQPVITRGLVNTNAKNSLEYERELYLPKVAGEGARIEFYKLKGCWHNTPLRMLWQPTNPIFEFFKRYRLD